MSPTVSLPPLPLTGERTVPDVPDEAYWFARHEIAYELASGFATGRRVLDAGCGEGYGLAMLRRAGAVHVVGADLDARAIAHARARYATSDPAVEVHECELMALPLTDDAVDLVVSFQVIEHLHDIPGYLASLCRVTRPGGRILIATPNRLTFTPDSDTPVNPFHTVEFTATELTDVLATAGLRVTAMWGVHHGPRLAAVERVTRRPFTYHLTAGPPDTWPRWVRGLVHRVRAHDFTVRTRDLDRSLDLLAVCRVP